MSLQREDALQIGAEPVSAKPSTRPSAKALQRRDSVPARWTMRRSELDALLAVIDLLERESDTARAFPALVDIVRPVLEFDDLAISEGVLLTAFAAPGLHALRPTTTAIVDSARRYFAGQGSLEDYAALLANQSRRWISLPLSNDGKEVVGVLTVGTSASLGEGTLAFLSCIARHLGRSIVAARDAERPPVSRATELARLLEGEASLGRAEALSRLTRGASSLLAGHCAIDFEDGSERRRVLEDARVSESVLAILDRVSPRVIAGRAVVCAAGGGGPPVDEIDRARQELAAGWLVAAPIVVDGRALGVFTVFGNDVPGRACALVERFAESAAKVIARTSETEDARAMLRERDEMLSTVSHDLQNPLGVILMSAATLLEGMPPDGDRRRSGRTHVEAIERNARRMKRLVADLLAFDAIEAGRLSMAPKATHPRALISAAIEDTRLSAHRAGVALRRGALVRLPLVWADTERIVQVLLNLLTNAIKFTPRGGRITVRARRVCEEEVTFFVQDSGIGIAPDELAHVFERHYQAPSSGPVRKLGSGLGLSICKSLVELSRGRIWATSRRGRGTTMMFSLPVATGDGLPE